MSRVLHADHVDTSGEYAKRYNVIKELYDNGQISEIPKEFADSSSTSREEKYDSNGEPIGYTPIKDSQGFKMLTEYMGMYGGAGGITSSGFD